MPTEKIPRYLGKAPDGVRVTFAGADDELGLAFNSGEEVVLLVRGRAKTANFKENQFGALSLQQQIKVSHAIVVDEAEEVALWERMRAEMKRREDESAGQTSLDDEIDGDPPQEGETE